VARLAGVITPGAEFELWVAFTEALAETGAEERIALLEDVVRRADATDAERMTYLSRRALADANRLRGRWDVTYRLFRECLDEYDRRPWRFTPDDRVELLLWYAWLVECMVDFPEFGLHEIREALDDVERRFVVAGRNLHEVHSARRGVAAHLGEWDVAERAYLRWTATADTGGDDRWLDLVGVEQLLARGDEESVARAHRLAAPLLADPSVSDRLLVFARILMLLPLAVAGQWDDAVRAYRGLRWGMAGGAHWIEQHGRLVEFCALTGNEAEGVDRLGPLTGFEARKRPFATMEAATSIAVLADAQVRAGRGDIRLDLGDGDPNSGPFRVVADRMRATALDLADRFDRRNGTTTQGDRVRARLDARPLVDFLPLAPTSRPPLRPVTRGLSDDALLERARWHDLRCEGDESRACLAAVSANPSEHVAAQVAELHAKFFQGPETESVLRHCAEVCRRHGDERLALLGDCWLGLLVVHLGRVEEGVAVTSDAVEGLRALGDDGDLAWGEHWLAHVLAGLGRHAEARAALERGKRHAEAAGDVLALGTLLQLEGTVFPTTAVESASAALAAFLAAEAPEKALESLALLENAYRERGDTESWRRLVDRLLARPATPAVGRFSGRLRYSRACALMDEGRHAEAVDDLTEAIGQAALREGASVEQWHRLVLAAHAAGRHEDAVDAGLVAAPWLDHLRDTEDAAWGEWADQARHAVAESYRLLGHRVSALREYRVLADGSGPLAATAFVAASALVEELADRV
jgi:tetratricopeptide (TPR) repeat protein